MLVQTTTLRIRTYDTVRVIPFNSGNAHSNVLEFGKRAYSVVTGRTREPHISLLSLRDISATQNLVLEVENQSGEIKSLSLPEDIYNGLIRYFQNTTDFRDDVDCLGMIVQILGGKRDDRFVDDGDYKYLGVDFITDVSTLFPGDILSMSDGTKEGWDTGRFHYALYIGDNLFLSKHGKGGILGVVSFEQLQGIYSGLRFIVKLNLKKK